MNDEHPSPPSIHADADEREYLLRRAEAHRHLADIAQQSASRSIHQRLQRLYRQRANRIDMVHSD